MLARPLAREIARTGEPDFVRRRPGYQCDPAMGPNSSAAVVTNLQERDFGCRAPDIWRNQKSIFSVMNYLLLVEDDVHPGNVGQHASVTHETAVFFGLNGQTIANPRAFTGTATTSTVGPDMDIFNIEGGLLRQCEGLDAFHEPRDLQRRPLWRDSAKTWCSMRTASQLRRHLDYAQHAWYTQQGAHLNRRSAGMGTTPASLFLT